MHERLLATPLATWEVDQAIVLDWYDGPRETICRLRVPAIELHTRCIAVRHQPDGLDDLLHAVAVLPDGTTARALAALAFAGAPGASAWIPMFRHDDPEVLARARATLDDALAAARPVPVVIQSADLRRFDGVWPVPADRAVSDWFAYIDERTGAP